MRDALGVFLCLTLLAATGRAIRRERWPLLVLLPTVGCLYWIRPKLALISTVGVAGGAVVRVIESSTRTVSLRELFPVAAVEGLALLPIVGPRLSLETAIRQLNIRFVGGGAYLKHVTYESWVDLGVAAPIRAVYFQFTPFPLHMNSALDLVAVLITPLLIVLTVVVYRCVRSCRTDTPVLVLILTTYALGALGCGLINSNFGTTVRHRIPFTFLLCIFAIPTLER